MNTEGGSLVVDAIFKLNAEGVDPATTLGDVSSSLSALLANSGEQFESIASSFGTTFDSAAELFNSIAEDDRITLLLNAKLDVTARLELSFESIALSAIINESSMSFLAKISDSFDVTIGSFGDIHINPSIQLRLQVENTATPFDIASNPSALGFLTFDGDLEATMNVFIDNIPLAISLRAYAPYLTNMNSLGFEVKLDIDLVPIQDSEWILLILHDM